MPVRFLVIGTLVGGVLLSVLGFLTAAVLPPRYKQFSNPAAVVDAVRTNAPTDDIYTARGGVFVAVSLHAGPPQNIGRHLIGQFAIEFAVAFGLSALIVVTGMRSALATGGLFGLAGLLAGLEMHFPEWNWSGFPASHLLAGTIYPAANWFIVGVVLGALRRRGG